MAPLLGYWDIRGLAEPIRYLLSHVGEEFTEKRYEVKSSGLGQMDRDNWLNEKFTLDLPFPNLPYLIDGDVKLTQSLAILRYLGRKYGLDANSEQERQNLDVLEQQLHDLLFSLIMLAYSPDFSEKKDEYLKNLPDKLKPLDSWMCGKKWFIGDRITYVDFYAYEAFDHLRLLEPTCLDQFPELHDFTNRVEALPNIKKYLNSSSFKKWPLYSAFATWGFFK